MQKKTLLQRILSSKSAGAKMIPTRRPPIEINSHMPTGPGNHKQPELNMSQIFAKDKTSTLIKKYFVYKLMGSNLFINYSLGLMNVSYRLLGVRLTNFAINKSVGSLFTSGESI